MTKSIGCGLLAMAVSTSIALASGGGGEGDKKNETLYQGGAGLSWKPGSGITVDGGDQFSLNIKSLLQAQWAFEANDGAIPDTNSFTVRRARTSFSGHVWDKNILYKLKLEATDAGANVKDAWAQFNFMHDEGGTVGVRVGQGKTFFGLESTGSSAGLFFVERSTATSVFADVRTRGAWVHGSHSENKIRWNFGAQNGEVAGGVNVAEVGEETPNADNELNFVANVSIDPMGPFMGSKDNEGFMQGDLEGAQELVGTIGGGVEVGNNRDVGNNFDVESLAININTAWRSNNLGVQGEVYLRSDDPQNAGGVSEDSMGWYAQGTYVLPKSGDSELQWGLGVRINMIDTDTTAVFLGNPFGAGAGGKLTEISGVVDAFYHGHAAKTQLEYTWQDVDPDGAGSSITNHILRVQFSLVF